MQKQTLTVRQQRVLASAASVAAFAPNPIYAAISAPGALPCLLDTAQAASALCLKTNTLEIWRLQGKGPVWAKIRTAVRYRSQDILAFIESQLRTSTSDKGEEN